LAVSSDGRTAVHIHIFTFEGHGKKARHGAARKLDTCDNAPVGKSERQREELSAAESLLRLMLSAATDFFCLTSFHSAITFGAGTYIGISNMKNASFIFGGRSSLFAVAKISASGFGSLPFRSTTAPNHELDIVRGNSTADK